jgi:hypothetical protein
MMQLLQRYPLYMGLAAVAAVLVVVLGLETGWGLRIVPTAGSGTVKAAAVDAKLLPAIAITSPEQAYPETGSRPLFTPTRRAAPASAASANMVKGQYALHGVTIVGDLRIGMLKEKASGRTVRAEKGKEVNGMTVAEVEADRVTLKLGDDSETLQLMVQRGAGAPAAAPAAAAQFGPFAGPPPAAAAAPASVPAPPTAPPPGASQIAPGAVSRAPPAPGPGTQQTIPGQTPASPSPGQRSDPPSAAGQPSAGTALTPEEILARRRARRTQQGTP